MKNLTQIKKIVAKHKSIIAKKFKVKEIAIFGSYARGDNKKNSDLDILVDFAEPISLFDVMDLEDYLQKQLRIKVDLVSRKALKPYIGPCILKEAVAI